MDEKTTVTPLAGVPGTTGVTSIDGITGPVALTGTDVAIADRTPTPSNIQVSQAVLTPSPAGTYSNSTLTINSKGHVTAGASGMALVAPVVPAWYPLGNPYYLEMANFNPGYNTWRGGFCAGGNLYLSQDFGNYFVRISDDFSTVTALNLAAVDPIYKRMGFSITDGKFGYIIPANQGGTNCKFLRIDLQAFNTTSMVYNDLYLADTSNQQLMGGTTDGNYAYLLNTVTNKIVRVNLATFTQGLSAITMLDLSGPLGGSGGFGYTVSIDTDGTNIYVLWAASNQNVISVTPIANFTAAATTTQDISTYGCGGTYQNMQLVGDNIYVQLTDWTGSNITKVVRIPKSNLSQGTTVNLSAQNASITQMIGTCADAQGRFLYIAPYMGSVLARVDLNDFQTVEWLDLAPLLTSNYYGEFESYGMVSDGRYAYTFSDYPGGVARFQLFNGGHY